MKDLRSYFLLLALFVSLLSTEKVTAQADSLLLSAAVVFGDSLGNTKNLNHSLSTVFSSNPKVQLNSRGPVGLATLTMRGGNSSQVGVRWNGLEVSSPLLGQYDVILLNPGFFSFISASSENHQTSNSGISGDLNLNNKVNLNNGIGWSYFTRLHSFSNSLHQAEVSFSTKKTGTVFKIFNHSGWNNYPIPTLDNGVTYQKHAHSQRSGVLFSQLVELNKHHSFSLNTWIQDSKVNIPPRIDQLRNTAKQNDSFTRVQALYRFKKRKNSVSLQLAFADEINHFIDEPNLINSKNGFIRYQARASLKREFKNGWSTALLLNGTHIESRTANYDQSYLRRIISYEGDVKKVGKKVAFETIGGITHADSAYHSSFRSKISYFINDDFQVHYQLHKNFRLPTLNDLYWKHSGNPLLKTEKSFSNELGVSYSKSGTKFKVSPEMTLYSRNTRDWILWTLNPSNNFWTPQNVNEVHSQGVELSIPFQFKFYKHLSIEYLASGQLSSSLFKSALQRPDISAGDQVYYAPRGSFYNSLVIQLKELSVKWELTYRGATHGVNYELENFVLNNGDLTKTISLKKLYIELSAGIRNAFNHRYEIIERTPLPGRHYTISLNLKNRKK